MAWFYVIADTLFGACYHLVWCKKHGINPLTVQPKERYVRATTVWVERLIELENNRNQSHSDQ